MNYAICRRIIFASILIVLDAICEEKSKISIRNILEATGASPEEAEQASIIIQVFQIKKKKKKNISV